MMSTSTEAAGGRFRPDYRRDIDGLRALAVLAVLGYHAFPSAITGGFVGVDIFFVISGYLITGIIQADLAHHSFSLAGFYQRRIRRIFPALLVVLVFCLLAGWHLLLADEYRQLGRHILSGAGFASNLLSWSESGYFDTTSERKPLLHLWSLGIEEQFYILWPLLLLLSHRLGKYRLPILAIFTVASFVWCLRLEHSSPMAAFYLPLCRAWELSLGAMPALPETRRWLAAHLAPRPAAQTRTVADPMLPGWIVVVAVLMILIAITWLDRYQDWPSAATLLPTLGTATLLVAGPGAWFNARILSRSWLVGVGLISYPLYLWHWPLLSFERIVDFGAVSVSERLLALGLAFALAWATYRWVEVPLRRRHPAPWRVLALGMAAIGLVGLACAEGLLKPRSVSFNTEKIFATNRRPKFPDVPMQPLPSRGTQFYRDGNGAKKTVYLGDSTIQQYSLRIDAWIKAHPASGRSAIFATTSGCPPLPGVKAEGHRGWCAAFPPDAFSLAAAADVDTVIIGATWYHYFAQAAEDSTYVFEDATGRYPLALEPANIDRTFASLGIWIGRLSRAGKKVYLVLDTPFGDELDPNYVVRRSLLHGFTIRSEGLDQRRFVAMTAPVDNALRRIGRENNAIVIDPVPSVCDGIRCLPLTPDGTPRFRDAIHFFPEFLRDAPSTYLDPTFGP